MPTRICSSKSDSVPVERHVFFWLTLAINRRNASLQKVLAPYGCKVAQWRVMNLLKQFPGSSVGRVAASTAVDRTTLTRTLDGLEAQGLIAREAEPANRRIVRLRLTPAGEHLYERILPVVRSQNAAALHGMSAQEARTLIKTLGKIVHNLGGPPELPETQEPIPRARDAR